ncbi:conjugal transfer protein TraR [Lujinxingia litoralis]|uniref:Conjugal transfer protein TraR n=1 Tax=Lujinxingia litoralis TaxID=2211119 RepID=A0A328C691_9DELT|nr:TraR/DksA family transcriptional regulator [Lujinxingia litoralis]RAL23029.1 conjugal transfer protein TraR [Lujinxingia litoralis]
MEEEELQALREKLLARRRELLTQGDLSVDPNRPTPVEHADEDEQPLNEMNQVIASKRNRARVDELRKIEAALQRMAADPEEFGLCLDCDEPIPVRRLELMPWATLCVPCQTKRSGPRRDGRRRHLRDFDD